MASDSLARVLRGNPTYASRSANAIRALSMDAVQAASSGHPGAPMGMAEMAVALWQRHLVHDPGDPHWPDRDRFVLSNGHASMILYALLHLTGYDLPMEQIRRFRQLGSKTPGHPEVDVTPGVETTTGPLGQGLSNAVGMALAEKLLADEFNRDGHGIVDHFTYCFVGDGCLMEGISHEVCSLAGTLGLGKLVVMYDANGISIDGEVEHWFGDDTARRFEAYGWHVVGPIDGHDVDAVDAAVGEAKSVTDRPSMIVCETTIGAGSPARGGTGKAHGEALGDDEIEATRKAIGWDGTPFTVPDDVYAEWDATKAGGEANTAWSERFDAYRGAHPELAAAFERRMKGELAGDARAILESAIGELAGRGEKIASRKASQQTLDLIAPPIPELLGGSADITGSNLTNFKGVEPVRAGRAGGRHINYGVREFGMAGIMNGVALHGGYVPYGGTFLTFSDYSRNAIRMAALMKRRVIHVFTHDSIGLGEDGPTHQSVEHAASLRLIPNLEVWRPCDGAETAQAWASAVSDATRPSALLLSRQGLPAQERTDEQLGAMARGGYVLSERNGAVAAILATGSEVGLAMDAQKLLDDAGVPTRVVSIPSSTVFDRQDEGYRQRVLGEGLVRIGVEAGVTSWWSQYGCAAALGVDAFGESAPGPDVYEHFGLTAEKLAALVEEHAPKGGREA